MKDWLSWLIFFGTILLTAVLISAGIAIHNPAHYGAHSVGVTVLFTLGVEGILTALCMLVTAA